MIASFVVFSCALAALFLASIAIDLHKASIAWIPTRRVLRATGAHELLYHGKLAKHYLRTAWWWTQEETQEEEKDQTNVDDTVPRAIAGPQRDDWDIRLLPANQRQEPALAT